MDCDTRRSPNAEYLHARASSSRLEVLDAGYFVWDEAPGQYEPPIAGRVTAD